MTRYQYSFHKTRERAEDALDGYFAAGEVSQGERPLIECRRDHHSRIIGYAVTLQG